MSADITLYVSADSFSDSEAAAILVDRCWSTEYAANLVKFVLDDNQFEDHKEGLHTFSKELAKALEASK